VTESFRGHDSLSRVPTFLVFLDGGGICYIRSTTSYRLLSEYILLLTQKLASYPFVTVASYVHGKLRGPAEAQ
jgi:hypothetical protein